jgi:ABC-type amino acid transport system permease subunit
LSSLPSAPAKVPIWRDVRVLRWLFQIAVLVVVGLIIYWIWGNYQTNIERSSVPQVLPFQAMTLTRALLLGPHLFRVS